MSRVASRTLGAWLLSSAVSAVGCSDPVQRPAPTSPDEGSARGKLASCLGLGLQTTIAWLIAEEAGGLPSVQQDCLSLAGSCDEVLLCLGVEPGPCEGGGKCDHNAARLCWPLRDREAVVQVSRCADDRDGNDECYLAPTHDAGMTFPMCGAGTCSANACDGDTMIECINGVSHRIDCKRLGKRCEVAQGLSFCAFPDACSESYCDGNTAVLCENGRVIFRQACSGILPEATCIGQGVSVACGAPTDSPRCDTSPAARSEECSDARHARACYQGIWVDVDCGVFGGSCVAEPGAPILCTAPT